nr:hypothetical protein GCM10020093_083820 [Planobispora longispora]
MISKAAGFAGLILVLVAALHSQIATWAPIIAIIAALTMTAGNLLALRQRNAVRLLAWSSVAQSGYILAPLGVEAPEAVGASIAYLVFYAAMNLGAFTVVMLVSRWSERGELDDYRGLASRSPAAGLALAFFLICLAGLPGARRAVRQDRGVPGDRRRWRAVAGHRDGDQHRRRPLLLRRLGRAGLHSRPRGIG